MSKTLKILLLALMLANITGGLFSDGFVPVKLADKRAPAICLDAESEKFANAPIEPLIIPTEPAPEIVPIIAVAAHRPFLITQRPRSTGPPAA